MQIQPIISVYWKISNYLVGIKVAEKVNNPVEIKA